LFFLVHVRDFDFVVYIFPHFAVTLQHFGHECYEGVWHRKHTVFALWADYFVVGRNGRSNKFSMVFFSSRDFYQYMVTLEPS
jgi:hypothetical protein